MITQKEANPAELLDQVAQAYFGAVKSGLKLQEDVASQWVDLIRQVDGREYLPQAFQQVVKEIVPLAQKQTDDALKMIQKGTRQGLELLTQAFAAGQVESPAAMQARLEKLWEDSLSTLRENAETMVHANARLMEHWATIAKKNMERATAAAPKAKAA